MTKTLRCCVFFAVLSVVAAQSAVAQLTLGAKSAMPQNFRYDQAFDRVNKVYLIIWDNSPITGQFADAKGVPFGPRFTIAAEGNANLYTSWANVTAGGPDNDPVFLVTYSAVEGSAVNRYARMIRYSGGNAIIGGRVLMANITSEWFAAHNARAAWDGDHFVATTRVFPAGSPYPMPQVQRIDITGAVSAPVLLGDFLDYEGSPSIACSPDHVCAAVGFASGMPFGAYVGGVFGRLFSGSTLQPIGSVFYLDHSSFMDTPQIVFNPRVGKFLTAFYRRLGNTCEYRTLGTDGALGPLDLSKNYPAGCGDMAMAFNDITQSTLLVTKAGNNADLYGIEIGDDGYPDGTTTLVTPYDNSGWPTYSTAIAPSTADGSWLVTYMLGKSGWAIAVNGKSVGTPVDQPNPAISIDYPTAGSVQTTSFKVLGWAADLGSSTGSGADAVHVWAWPTDGSSPIPLGVTTPSIARSDVGSIYGSRFTNTGYSLDVTLPPGGYMLAAYMHSTVTNTFNAVRTVSINVSGSNPLLSIDIPGNNATVSSNGFLLGGWAIDRGSQSDAGMAAVHLWAFPSAGGSPIFAGAAQTGIARPDIAGAFGAQFVNSGFGAVVTLPPGAYDIGAYGFSSVSGTFTIVRFVHVVVQ